MPLISVVIPVYNGEKTIRETIDSVLNQTFNDFELIIINDGSTDSTLDVVKAVEDSRLKVCSYPNAGQPASRNRGIAQSTGEYVTFLDADDLWTPNKLESQLKTLQANPEAALAYSWTDSIDESGQQISSGTHASVAGNVYKNLLMTNFVASGSNPLIRKQAFAEVGLFDETLSNAHDWDMWLRLAVRYPFVAVLSADVIYRQSNNSMSSNVKGMEISSLQVIERAIAQAPEPLEYLKPKILGNLYKYLTWKSLEGYPKRQKSLAAITFLWKALDKDPKFVKTRTFVKVLLKIVIMLILPAQQAQGFFTNVPQLFDTTTILGYIDLNPALAQSDRSQI